MERDKQIAKCQTQEMTYAASHDDASHRLKLGQVQVFCNTCGKWKWTDKLCPLAQMKPYLASG